MASLRRSGRETKQVELFGTFSQDNRKNNGTETDEEEVSVEEDRAPKPMKSALKKGKSNFTVPTGSRGTLIDTLATKKNSNFESEATQWIESYKRNKVPAMVEIVNFILRAAGATKDWIAHDVDLDPLGPAELDEMLREMIEIMSDSHGSDQYPLKQKNKGGSYVFREKFQAFFEQLAEKIYSMPVDSSRKSLSPMEMLHVLIDQLVSLSSMVLANIRDAVTEAACSLGKAILGICIDLKEQIAVAERQIKAEESGASKASLKTNQKYTSLVKTRNDANKEMESYSELANVIFNSLIVHRLKDSNDGVRAVALHHLFDFLLFDPVKAIRVEYLKYVGFSTFDYSAVVRTVAIKLIIKILEDKRFAGSLNEFVEHFLGHFISQAAGDVDHTVALLTIQALRLMQENALLDEVSEEVLDSVDVIVFDEGATPRVRQEAVAFLMDHTEGFDDATADTPAKGGKGKSKKAGGASAAGDEAGALARRQRNALQLETLTEFAEHHIQEGSYEASKYLAEACLMLPNYDVLYDWTTIVALLLRESEELISTALRPAQSSALLQMFVTSALSVIEAQQDEEGDGSLDAEYDALMVCLQKSLASLILRFRDDESALLVLLDLLPHCDFSHSNAAIVKNFRGLLKVATDVFFSVSNGKILEKVTSSLRAWKTSSEAAIQNAVTSSLKDTLDSVWGSIVEAIGKVQEAVKARESGNNNSSSSSVGNKRRTSVKKSLTPDSDGLDESLLSLANNVNKYKGLWMQLDCQALSTSQTVEDIVETLVSVAALCPEVAATLPPSSNRLGHLVVSAGQGAAWCVHNIILWVYKDVVSLGKEAAAAAAADDSVAGSKRGRQGNDSAAVAPKSKKAKGNRLSNSQSEEEAAAESLQERIQESVERLLTCRDSLVAALTGWLKLSTGNTEVERRLAVAAFRLISELRSYFPVRDSHYRSVDRLAFVPSHEVLNLLRGVFEAEGAAVKAQLLSATEEENNDDDSNKVANQLVLALLLPLSRNLLSDVQNLNRRQAAAVLNYLLDPSEAVQEAVKTVTRKLKESDIVKYLEIQMVLLKSVFGEHVVKAVKTRQAAEDNEDDSNFDLIQHAQLEAEGYAVVDDLARKLAQSLGVGKLRDEALIALENFFRVGLDYSLADMTQLGFTGVLSAYVRFLPPTSLKSLSEIVREHTEANQPLIDLLHESESSAFENLAVDKFSAFYHQLDSSSSGAHKAAARAGKRRGGGGAGETSRVSPPAKVPATKSRTAAAPKTAKATKAAPVAAPKKTPAAPAAAPSRSSGRAKQVSYREDSDEEEEEEQEEAVSESEGDMEVEVSRHSSQRRNSGASSASSGRGNKQQKQQQQTANSQESRRSTSSAVSSSSSSSARNGKVTRDFAMGLNIDDADESLAELDAIPSKRRSRY